jgi:hypothetical protein
MKGEQMLNDKVLMLLLAVTLIAGSLCGGTAAEAQFVSEGLVGRWAFDAIAERKIRDAVGTNDGAVKGNPRLVEGILRNAMRFSGSERIEIFAAKELELKDFTVDAWIKADEVAKEQKNSRILTKGVSGANYALTWHHTDWKKFSQSVSAQMTGGFFISSSTRKNPLEADVWYNLVGTYNGREMLIYVDTELRNKRTWAGTPIVDPTDLTIGAMTGGGGPEGFEGVIDEVKIYNRALTPAEIVRNYEKAKALAVEDSPDKLAITWGELKRNR